MSKYERHLTYDLTSKRLPWFDFKIIRHILLIFVVIEMFLAIKFIYQTSNNEQK